MIIHVNEPEEQLFCEKCDAFVDFDVIDKKEVYEVKGDKIEIDAKVAICKKCGNELFDIDCEDYNLRRVYRIYAKRHGLILPEDIKRIRENLGLTQKQFALLLGLDTFDIERYENGSLISEEHSELIRRAEKDYDYDAESDVMYISFGEPKPAYGTGDFTSGIIVRRDFKTDEVVGLTIIGFKKLMEKLESGPVVDLLKDIAAQWQNAYRHNNEYDLFNTNPYSTNETNDFPQSTNWII